MNLVLKCWKTKGLKLRNACPVIGVTVGERINISIACGGVIFSATVDVNLGSTNIDSLVTKDNIIDATVKLIELWVVTVVIGVNCGGCNISAVAIEFCAIIGDIVENPVSKLSNK